MHPFARCVVKATSPGRLEYWNCPTVAGRFQGFGAREVAEVFASGLEVNAAIDALPSVLGTSGVTFTVEPAD
jgi:hypothetical protein